MRSTLTRSFLTLTSTACVVLCSSFHLEAAPATSAARSGAVEVNRAGAVLMPVLINGEGPFAFLVDTGATSSAIADTLTDRLKLEHIGKTLASTAAGSAEFDIVSVTSLTATGRESGGLRLAVMPLAALDAAAPHAMGILGQDVLRQANFTIDYERARFTWEAPVAAADSQHALALKWTDGRWLVNLSQDSKGGAALWMVADSGASALVFFDRGSALALRTSPLDLPADVTTLSGTKSARGVIVHELHAGSATLHDQPALIVDRRAGGTDSDGLLPLCAFARVTFDVAAGTMTVQARR